MLGVFLPEHNESTVSLLQQNNTENLGNYPTSQIYKTLTYLLQKVKYILETILLTGLGTTHKFQL